MSPFTEGSVTLSVRRAALSPCRFGLATTTTTTTAAAKKKARGFYLYNWRWLLSFHGRYSKLLVVAWLPLFYMLGFISQLDVLVLHLFILWKLYFNGPNITIGPFHYLGMLHVPVPQSWLAADNRENFSVFHLLLLHFPPAKIFI